MRRHSFIITILGLVILLAFLNKTPIIVSSQQSLEQQIENQKVQTSGFIISQRNFGSSKILTLENEIELICDCSFINKNISAIGLKQTYREKTRIQVLKIEEN